MPLSTFNPLQPCGLKLRPVDDPRWFWMMDDFISGYRGNYIDDYFWVAGGTGGGVTYSSSVPYNNGGLGYIGCTAGYYYSIYQAQSLFRSDLGFDITWRGRINSTSDITASFGLADNVPNPTNFIAWMADSALSANWVAVCQRVVPPTVSSIVDTGVALNTGYHEFRICFGMGGTNASIFLDGVPYGSLGTDGGRPTADMGLKPFAQVSSSGNVRYAIVDYFEGWGGRLP